MKSNFEVLRFGRNISREWPVNITAADELLFRESYTYSTLDCRLTSVPDAWVAPNSVVYKNFKLLPDSLYSPNSVGYHRLRYLAKLLLTARKVVLDSSSDYLLATDQESSGHFHWFTESMPRLWLVKDRAQEFVLLLPDTTYMRSIALESLRTVGLRFKEIFWMQSGEFYRVPRLHHISKVAQSGEMDDAIMMDLNQAFIGSKPPGHRKLYVSRAKARFRKVLNEGELQELLKGYDFEIIQPDDWTLARQVSAFSTCTTLVSLHGAGLTNCLFMPRQGKVVELRKREPNYGYWNLVESVGSQYFYYHGIPDSDLSLIGRGCNLTIPIDDFEERILKNL